MFETNKRIFELLSEEVFFFSKLEKVLSSEQAKFYELKLEDLDAEMGPERRQEAERSLLAECALRVLLLQKNQSDCNIALSACIALYEESEEKQKQLLGQLREVLRGDTAQSFQELKVEGDKVKSVGKSYDISKLYRCALAHAVLLPAAERMSELNALLMYLKGHKDAGERDIEQEYNARYKGLATEFIEYGFRAVVAIFFPVPGSKRYDFPEIEQCDFLKDTFHKQGGSKIQLKELYSDSLYAQYHGKCVGLGLQGMHRPQDYKWEGLEFKGLIEFLKQGVWDTNVAPTSSESQLEIVLQFSSAALSMQAIAFLEKDPSHTESLYRLELCFWAWFANSMQDVALEQEMLNRIVAVCGGSSAKDYSLLFADSDPSLDALLERASVMHHVLNRISKEKAKDQIKLVDRNFSAYREYRVLGRDDAQKEQLKLFCITQLWNSSAKSIFSCIQSGVWDDGTGMDSATQSGMILSVWFIDQVVQDLLSKSTVKSDQVEVSEIAESKIKELLVDFHRPFTNYVKQSKEYKEASTDDQQKISTLLAAGSALTFKQVNDGSFEIVNDAQSIAYSSTAGTLLSKSAQTFLRLPYDKFKALQKEEEQDKNSSKSTYTVTSFIKFCVGVSIAAGVGYLCYKNNRAVHKATGTFLRSVSESTASIGAYSYDAAKNLVSHSPMMYKVVKQLLEYKDSIADALHAVLR